MMNDTILGKNVTAADGFFFSFLLNSQRDQMIKCLAIRRQMDNLGIRQGFWSTMLAHFVRSTTICLTIVAPSSSPTR
jgi:ABC-type spermidine/putrescine transport system permease subunit II